MYSKEVFIRSLSHATYYKAICAWIKKNYNPDELSEVRLRHPDYKGSLLKYYIDQAAVIYVSMKCYQSNEILYQPRSIYFDEGHEYVFKPLTKLALLGALWCVIVADESLWKDDKVKARDILEQMEMISPSETDSLRQAIGANHPLIGDYKANAALIVDEVELAVHPELAKRLQQHFQQNHSNTNQTINIIEHHYHDNAVHDDHSKNVYIKPE